MCAHGYRKINGMMETYTKCGKAEWVLGLLESDYLAELMVCKKEGKLMTGDGTVANSKTFVPLLTACARMKDGLEKGMAVHSLIRKSNLENNVYIASALIDMYVNSGSVYDARCVFDKMCIHDVVTWNALLHGYVENKEEELALELFWRMYCVPNARSFLAALMACSSSTEKGVNLEKVMRIHSAAMMANSDMERFVANALVDAYAKCGSTIDARLVFDKIDCRDVVMWTSLIQGYAENGESQLALEMFTHMRPRLKPNARTYLAALVACSEISCWSTGCGVCGEIYREGLENDDFLASGVLDFCGRSGKMDHCVHAFSSNAVSKMILWNALVTAYSRQGDVERVFSLVECMHAEGVSKPNRITLLSVLSACSHAGLVETGKKVLYEMFRVYKVAPEREHYHTVIDMLVRANMLYEALQVAESMEFEGNIVTWMILLGGCSKWRNVDVGRVAFNKLLALDVRYSSAYVLMASIYENAHLHDEVSRVLDMQSKVTMR